MTGEKKFVLIDGHSLAYRAFYALPAGLATSTGQQTNAVYGFTSMLIKVLEELRPGSVLVAFDKGRPEFRLERYADYKAHRKPMPDELREQMELIKGVLDALSIPYVEKEGFEADDVIATLVEAIPDDTEVFIVTGDRDALQLVDGRVKVVANRKGITDIVIYDPAKVKERYGVEPSQIVDYLALKGDSSDNIPGVPGIGEKTASSLVSTYADLEGVYAHLSDVKGARWKKILEENRESAFLSRELARLRRDVPIGDLNLDAATLRPWDDEKARTTFSSLEFKTLYRRLQALRPLLFAEKEDKKNIPRVEGTTIIRGEKQVEDFIASCIRQGEVSIFPDIRGEGFTRGKLLYLAMAVNGRTYFLDVEAGGGSRLLGMLLSGLEEHRGLRLIAYRGKDLMVQFHRLTGKKLPVDFDVRLASYLLDPSSPDHLLEDLYTRYLGISLPSAEKGQLDLLEPEKTVVEEGARKALLLGALAESLESEMALRELRRLYEDVEIPLQEVLADMETRGIRLDVDFLREMEERLRRVLEGLEEEIYDLAGRRFNLNSPQQLSHVLFEVLGLTPQKKTKTGYATDVSVLNSLKEDHPIAGLLLKYRELSKLINTYISSLPRLVDPRTGRLHACFNQTVTATGRLSSSNPNLQNIPVRTPLGREIRRAFLPSDDRGSILCADYSQIELRIVAHFSGDEGLLEAFARERDVHSSTAAEVFGVPYEEVTHDLRRRAKAINFGIIYGISPYGLAEQLGVEREEAEDYIRAYFHRFPKVREFLDRQVEEARRTGYVVTILGRRRDIPELCGADARLRRLGERLAFNTPVQGSAADIIKLAMVRIHREMKKRGLRSGMILQVHDELVFDVAPGEEEELSAVVRECMEGAVELRVPLKVDMGIGPTWYDAK
jgi:DNA polymerase-1